MPLISNGEIVADPWTRLGDEETLPPAGDAILPWQRAGEIAAAGDRAGRTGVTVPNTVDPRELAALLPKLDLVALVFPAFTDGRAYSQAWILRNELGFRGEIRATGQVLADQAAFMQRCGFDTFECDGRQPLEVWQRAQRSVTLAYQRDYRRRGFEIRESAGPENDRAPPGAEPDGGEGYRAAVADLVRRGSAHFG